MKKTLKIIGIILGIVVLLLLAAPFIFKGSLEKILKRTINQNLNATRPESFQQFPRCFVAVA